MKISKLAFSRAIFILTCSTSIILMITGFILPPPGVIDGSVLTAGGIMLAFAALAQLPDIIKSGHSAKFEAGGASVTLTGHKNTDKEHDEFIED